MCQNLAMPFRREHKVGVKDATSEKRLVTLGNAVKVVWNDRNEISPVLLSAAPCGWPRNNFVI